MSRTSCYGRCPIYTVSVNARGEVHYLGEKYVREAGVHSWQITPDAAAELKTSFLQTGFMQITQADCDECPGRRTDHSSIHFEVQVGDSIHTLRYYTGCYGKEIYAMLTAPARQVDRVFLTQEMVKIDSNAEPWKSEREERIRRSNIESAWVMELAPPEAKQSKFTIQVPSFELKEEILEAGGSMNFDGRLLVLVAPWGDEPIGGLQPKWPQVLDWASSRGLESIRVWEDGATRESVDNDFDYSKPIPIDRIPELYEYVF